MQATTDARLVAEAARGDEQAFARLGERHRARTRTLAHRILGDWAEAEDVTQEALLQAYLGLDALRDPSRFGAWLAGIAVNLAKMRVRQRRSGWTLPEDFEGGRRWPTVPEPSAEGELVREALDELPAAQREALVLHYLEGLSTKEIAFLSGGSPGAVRVRLHRARTSLRQRLAPRKEVATMVEVELKDVVVRVLKEDADAELPRLAAPHRIVRLQEKDGARMLPIWIGAFEGDALALRLGGEDTPRPYTHDLMLRLLDATGARVERVAVVSLVENTFYAIVSIAVDGRTEELDSRPSDALNLAVRAGVPIYVAEEVMAACLPSDRLEAEWLKYAPEVAELGPSEFRPLTPELVKSMWPKPPEPK